MIDPIDPSIDGYILDIQRLYEIIKDFPYDAQVMFAIGSVDNAVHLAVKNLDVTVVDNDVIFTYNHDADDSQWMWDDVQLEFGF